MKKALKIILGVFLTIVLVFTGLITYKIQTGGNNTVTIPMETLDVLAADDDKTILSSNIESSVLDLEDMFSDRDLAQVVDLTESMPLTLNSNEDTVIKEEGIYLVTGDFLNSTIRIEADDKAKVQLVLDGVTITNDASPAIYVASADKVFITTTESENSLAVTGLFVPEGDVNLDAVIYSTSDLTFNGLGSLDITSTKGNGITAKDDLKVTGGTYTITAEEDGLEANDSIRIYNGSFAIESGKDALHSENEEDLTIGYIYIRDGVFNLNAGDDAIRANSIVQIDDGDILVTYCVEGIEASYIQINGGSVDIYSANDAINAANKSVYPMKIEVNGGDIAIALGQGDTDGFDSNGDLTVNDGIISVSSAMAAFDVDGVITWNGGQITVDGQVIDEIETQQIGIGMFLSKFGGGDQ